MGHLFFLFIHLIAGLFATVYLLLTIPLHLIYAGSRRKSEPQPNRWTHVRCPDCRELVLKDANKCKHCGCALTPQ